MARRVTLPAADDLFRRTDGGDDGATTSSASRKRPVSAVPSAIDEPADGRRRRSSGRVRHDEKMTVYVTAEELLDIEHARLALRRDHGLAVDRGRLVREALAIALGDLEERGGDSDLVRRLDR